jgi:hypothetical protein
MQEDTIMPPEGKKSFKVMMRQGKNGVMEKAIFIDGELLDWSVDITSLMDAKKMAKNMNSPYIWREVQKDIAKHFLEAVSDTLGLKVTEEDIKTATATGWI